MFNTLRSSPTPTAETYRIVPLADEGRERAKRRGVKLRPKPKAPPYSRVKNLTPEQRRETINWRG
jgi:hypothetical protein